MKQLQQEPAYKKLIFSKEAGQFLMKTPNFDKQAEKFLITPVKKRKKYQCKLTSLVMMSHTSYLE